MFENSLIGRLPLRCQQHQKAIITHVCVDSRCEGWPLFCEECRNSYRFKERHYGHELSVLELSKGIEQICGRLQREKRAAGTIYKQMMGLKGVQGLLKWQQQKQQHFNSIENHINTIKFQVQQQIGNIMVRFQEELNKEKAKLYSELETYYKMYRQKFDKFSRLTEPIVSMQGRFKFYSTPTTLFFKISSETSQKKLAEWLSELKKTLSLAEKATNMPGEYSEQIKRYGELANEIMDDLPRVRNADNEREMMGVLSGAAYDSLRSFVKLKEQRFPSGLNRSNSVQIPPSDAFSWKNSANFR